MKRLRFISVLAFLLCSVANAAVVNLNSYDDRSYYVWGGNYYTNAADIIYLASPNEFRSGFAFDLSAISESIVSATLQLNFQQQNGAFQLTAYEVTSDANDLITANGNYQDFFTDLGDGVAFSGTQGSPNFTLNASALADLNSKAGGLFAIGVRNTANGTYYWANGASLTLTTVAPEPAEVLLIILGLATIMYFCRKEKIELPA